MVVLCTISCTYNPNPNPNPNPILVGWLDVAIFIIAHCVALGRKGLRSFGCFFHFFVFSIDVLSIYIYPDHIHILFYNYNK